MFCSFIQAIFFVAHNTRDCTAFDEVCARLTIPVNDVIYRPCIVALENIDMDDILSDKDLIAHFNNLIATISVEDDDVVQIGTVEQVISFL